MSHFPDNDRDICPLSFKNPLISFKRNKVTCFCKHYLEHLGYLRFPLPICNSPVNHLRPCGSRTFILVHPFQYGISYLSSVFTFYKQMVPISGWVAQSEQLGLTSMPHLINLLDVRSFPWRVSHLVKVALGLVYFKTLKLSKELPIITHFESDILN